MHRFTLVFTKWHIHIEAINELRWEKQVNWDINDRLFNKCTQKSTRQEWECNVVETKKKLRFIIVGNYNQMWYRKKAAPNWNLQSIEMKALINYYRINIILFRWFFDRLKWLYTIYKKKTIWLVIFITLWKPIFIIHYSYRYHNYNYLFFNRNCYTPRSYFIINKFEQIDYISFGYFDYWRWNRWMNIINRN